MAYFSYVNDNGGVNGRRIVLKLYDDGYQPDTCVANTLRLMRDDDVFLLFGYVGTPTFTRVLPLLKRFRDRQVYLFFPFTGAEPQREPPYGEFAFNLRASYRQETAGLVDNFVRIGRRRVAVFYQIDAYGRSGWAGVREAFSGLLASPRSLAAPLHRGRGERGNQSDNINPKHQPSVKAGQVQEAPAQVHRRARGAPQHPTTCAKPRRVP